MGERIRIGFDREWLLPYTGIYMERLRKLEYT